MPNLVAYNSGNTISNSIQFGTIVMDVNGDVAQGSLNWCPDFGICNQYLIITDTYTNEDTDQLSARPMGFQTSGLTDSDLIEGINKLAASKFEGPFGSLSEAINWAIYEGYFITNQEYPTIVTSGCVLNLDSNFPPSYPLVFDTWYDLTGNGNTGLLNNGITYNSALRGSLLLNGTDQYVSFSATTDIPVGNSDYTISVWFNPASLGDKGLVGWGNYGSTNEANALRLSSTGIVNYWWANDLAATYTFTLGNWYNAVAKFDGTTRSIWVNGTLIGSDTPSGHNVPTSNNLTVGVTNSTEFFDGNMGEVQIFNRALSSSEIYDNYNALYPRYNGTYTDPCDIAPQCTRTPTNTPSATPVYYYYLVYDVNINCNAYDGVVYRSATDYSATILSGQYLYVNGNFLSLKYIETTYEQAYVNTLNSILITSCLIPSQTQTMTPSHTATPTPVYYYYLVYDVNINCNAYDGVVYRTTTDYSSSILTGQYTFVNGNTGTLKYIETTYPQAYVNTLNSIVIASCLITSPTQTMTPSHTATPTPVYYYYLVYDVNINCNAYDGVVYRTTTDYSENILTGQYAYVNGNFSALKYVETTYVQAFVDTLNSIVITSCIFPSPTPTVTTTPTLTLMPNYKYYFELVDLTNPPNLGGGSMTFNSSAGEASGVTFYTNYNLGLFVDSYSPNSSTVSSDSGKRIQKIDKLAYDGTTILYSQDVTNTDYTFGTGSFDMTSIGTSPGQFQTIKVYFELLPTPTPTQTSSPTQTATPPSTPTLTQTPFPGFILNSTSGLTNGGEACLDYNINNRVEFFASTENGGTIHNGTFLYTSREGVGNSSFFIPDGYYSDGTTYWQFTNGSTGDAGTPCPGPTPTQTQTPSNTPPSTPASTPTLTQTPFPGFILNSTANLPNGGEACLDYNVNNRVEFFASTENGGTIHSGTFLYTSRAGVGNSAFWIPNGYYSNGTTYWQFTNGSTSDVGTACPAPSQTPTNTPPNTPPVTPPLTPSPTETTISYFYNAFVLTCDSGNESCTSTGTEAIIYSGNIPLSNGSYYSNGSTVYQPYGSTSNPGPGGYIDVTGIRYTENAVCYNACLAA